MFKRSITADLYAPKNVADLVDSSPGNLQADWRTLILDMWQKYQLPIIASLFLFQLVFVLAFDYYRMISIQDLGVNIEHQQAQIHSLQAELRERSMKESELDASDHALNPAIDLAVPDIKYWGMMGIGSTTKALIEINHTQKLLKAGQAIDDEWQLKYFDQEHMHLESKEGRTIKISMEVPS